MLARELMTVRPQCVTPDDPISAAAELMRELDVGIAKLGPRRPFDMEHILHRVPGRRAPHR